MASALADVEFYSDKSCFVLLDCPSLGITDLDDFLYLEIHRTNEVKEDPICVAGRLIRSGFERSGGRSTLLINGVFANCLQIKHGEQVLVSLAKEPKPCYSVVAEPASSDDWDVVLHNAEKIEEQLLVQLRLVYANMEFPVWIDGGYCLFLRIVSCDAGGSRYGLLMDDTEVTVAPKLSAQKSKATPDRSNLNPSSGDTSDGSSALLLRGVRFFDSMLDKLIQYASMVISEKDPIFLGHPLILGAAGSGKSMLSKALCEEMKNRKLISYSSIVECNLLKGKAVESVEKRLKDQIVNAVDSQPAIIVLDDLDGLCSSCSTMEQITPGVSMLFERMSRMLANLIKEVHHKRQRILFLATSVSLKTLNSFLISPRGPRFFDPVVEIADLDLNDRRTVIERFASHGLTYGQSADNIPKAVVSYASKLTDGYFVADLAVLVERALIAFEDRTGENGETGLTIGDFKIALDGFVPTALSGVTKGSTNQKDSMASFDSIGGLDDAKAVLEKVLRLPTKYPKVFSTLPIRLPRGVLLYGPSGCGKTYLAAAVAHDYHLNFIHIKGAELLSKYIGASEQGVRDTFTRAKSMKPCFVFFDEFDALAPRRGHDSTGVTDRVVNQLLTELDGVESLEGVFVLAASSRPDLIDPALLRPGRIDKRVYCGIPSKAERSDILIKLSKPLSVDPDVDFEAIAQKTDAFSGADLKTILLDAHLLALREATTALKRWDEVEVKAVDVRIMQRHVDHVMDSLKPSVSAQDRRRFEEIYRNFQGDVDEADMAKFYQENVGKRATLA